MFVSPFWQIYLIITMKTNSKYFQNNKCFVFIMPTLKFILKVKWDAVRFIMEDEVMSFITVKKLREKGILKIALAHFMCKKVAKNK